MEKAVEGKAPAWTPPCTEEIYAAEIETYAKQAAAGTLPELPNGYSLVFDPVEYDDPYFNGIIPAQQYTWHLAMRQIAVALPHTSIHSHDVTHIPGFQRMFSYAPYADLVQLAAFNALGKPELCAMFADAHDHFADQMLFLYRDDGFNQIANFPRARKYLDTLVRLAYMNAGYDDEEERLRRKATFDQLAEFFELAEYEHWYDTVYERFQVL